MDNSAVQSQGSMSSISTINQTLDPNAAALNANPSEFVNHGQFLLLSDFHWLPWIGIFHVFISLYIEKD